MTQNTKTKHFVGFYMHLAIVVSARNRFVGWVFTIILFGNSIPCGWSICHLKAFTFAPIWISFSKRWLANRILHSWFCLLLCLRIRRKYIFLMHGFIYFVFMFSSIVVWSISFFFLLFIRFILYIFTNGDAHNICRLGRHYCCNVHKLLLKRRKQTFTASRLDGNRFDFDEMLSILEKRCWNTKKQRYIQM